MNIRTLLPVLLTLPAFLPAASALAAWKRTADSVAWEAGGQTLWQFNHAASAGKPFFHPLRVQGSESLTTARPADHLWHYGLWFSWKFINGVNYWEEDAAGRAQGATKWDAPEIATRDDGSAEIKLALRYVSTNNATVLTERRTLNVSAPAADGGVTIDWTATFTAGDAPLVLDRNPMPGEPGGKVNGGYGGFALRTAQVPAKTGYVTAEGPVTNYVSDRARPNSKAAACNVSLNGRTDGVAILSHASNTGGEAPWYVSNSDKMRWFSPSLLAPKPIPMKAGESFTWKFRVITKAGAWTAEGLRAQGEAFNK